LLLIGALVLEELADVVEVSLVVVLVVEVDWDSVIVDDWAEPVVALATGVLETVPEDPLGAGAWASEVAFADPGMGKTAPEDETVGCIELLSVSASRLSVSWVTVLKRLLRSNGVMMLQEYNSPHR